MKDYLNDLLVWAIILAILIPIFLALFKRKQVFIFTLGLLIFLGAIPVALMSELSITGCCGGLNTGRNGLGYVIGVVMAIVGVSVMVFSKKLAKK